MTGYYKPKWILNEHWKAIFLLNDQQTSKKVRVVEHQPVKDFYHQHPPGSMWITQMLPSNVAIYCDAWALKRRRWRWVVFFFACWPMGGWPCRDHEMPPMLGGSSSQPCFQSMQMCAKYVKLQKLPHSDSALLGLVIFLISGMWAVEMKFH